MVTLELGGNAPVIIDESADLGTFAQTNDNGRIRLCRTGLHFDSESFCSRKNRRRMDRKIYQKMPQT